MTEDKGSIWHGYALWQGYSVSTTNEEARQEFIARYDREPFLVWRNGGVVCAGPITQGEHDGKMGRLDTVQ